MRKALLAAAVLLVLAGATAGGLLLAWRQGWIPWPRRALVAPPGPQMAEAAAFDMAVYLLREPTSDPLAGLDTLLAREGSPFKRAFSDPKDAQEAQVFARVENDVPGAYAPPDARQLQYFGRGLGPEETQALRNARRAVILRFAVPRHLVFEGNRAACRVMSALARQQGGLVWDEETREIFAVKAWDDKRVRGWTGEVPDVSDHIIIHSYQDEEFVRAITLGMAKFGLPDLVIERSARSQGRSVGHLINLTAQVLAEGGTVGGQGELRVSLQAIRNAQAREPQLALLKGNGTGNGVVVLRPAARQEGDAENRLLAIGFDRYAGNDVHSRQERLLSDFFGWEDEIRDVQHDEALLAASARAREKLADMKALFMAGLPPGEYLMVKAPFATSDGGNEWMWVEVTSWKGRAIHGLLQNEPFRIPTLRSGQAVDVRQDEVFDYIFHRADGRDEGNETSAIIEAQQKGPAASPR